MDQLIVFVRARLDEREARAKAADVKQGDTAWFVSPVVASAPRNFTVRSAQDKRPIARVADLAGDDDADTVGILDGEAVAAHIADNDPEFVLADVAAKREIIEQYENHRRAIDHGGAGICTRYLANELRKVLHLLALPFAGHPDYREDFRP